MDGPKPLPEDILSVSSAPPTAAHLRDLQCRCCFGLDAAAVENSQGDQGALVEGKPVSLRRTRLEIETAAASGCQICIALLEVLMFFGLGAQGDKIRSIHLRVPTGQGNLEISVHDSWTETYLQLYMSTLKTWYGIRPLPDIYEDHLSDDSLSFIKSCLQTCINDHVRCRHAEGSMPARLLEIGQRGDSFMRLIETDGASPANYVALSYCWGNTVATKTTLASLEQMKMGVDICELPQAYLDAITLTRELGVRYLWVDALCIIQDSHEDWEKESAKMSDIYSGAYLTIAAASSGSANLPFLSRNAQSKPNPDDYDRRIFTKQVVDDNGSHMLKARVIVQAGVHDSWHEFDVPVPVEPWSQRGWTLQEQLLSTRMLSFSLAEMQWSCQEAVVCECRSKYNHRRLFGPKPVSQITESLEAYRFWQKVVENYSKRNLSHSQDRLTALSGIAAILQKSTQSRYAAGLWAYNIEMDLLWRRASLATEPRRPGFVAPSFSWASTEGEIDYLCFRNGKWPYWKAALVAAVETNASLAAPLGRVDGGRLTIRGPLTPALIGTRPRGSALIMLGKIGIPMVPDTVLQHVTVTDADGVSQTTICRWNDAQKSAENSGHLSAKGPRVALVAGHYSQCWVLRLGCFPPTTDPEDQKWGDYELLVLGKSPSRPDDFERVGLVTYGIEKGQSEQFADLTAQEQLTTVTIV